MPPRRWPCFTLMLAACASRPPLMTLAPDERCAPSGVAPTMTCPCAVAEDFGALQHAPDLTALELHLLEPPDLERLSSFSKLRSLRIVDADSGRPEVELSPLAALAELRVLDLDGVIVRDLKPLSHLTKLEHLSLRCRPGVDPRPLLALDNLRELELAGAPMHDYGALTALKKLKVLKLGSEYDEPWRQLVTGAGDEASAAPISQTPEPRGLDEFRTNGVEVHPDWDRYPMRHICPIDPTPCPLERDSCPVRRQMLRRRD